MSFAATNPDKYFKGGAKVYFDLEDSNGALTGQRFLGSVKTIGSQLQETKIEAKDYTLPTPSVVKSVASDRKLEISLELQEFQLENLALGHAGELVAANQSSGSVTDQAINGIKLNRWYPVGAYDITTVSAKKGPSTAVALGVDYELDAKFGLIYIKSGGLFADGDNLLVSYTKAAKTMKKLQIGTKTVLEGRIVLRSNPLSGPRLEGTYWRAQLSPDGEMPWISEDFGTFKLKATVLADSEGHAGNEFGEIIEIV